MRRFESLAAATIAALALLAGCEQIAASGQEDVATAAQNGTMPIAFAGNQSGTAQGRAQVIDQGGLGRPMPALDVPLPQGWSFQSGVRWDNVNGQCSYAIASPMFRMTSPDGKAVIELLPGFLVSTSIQDIRRRGSMPGDFCVVAMADSGRMLAGQIAAPFLRPDARVVSVEDVALLPEVAQLAQRLSAIPAMPGSRMIPYTVEATLALPDGRAEILMLGGIVSAGQQMLPGVPPMVLNQNFVAYAWSAPQDRLAETGALARKIFAGMRPVEPWAAQVGKMRNDLTKPVFAQPKPSWQPGSGVAAGGNGGGGFDMGRWRQGQAADDITQRGRIEAIREEQTCADGRVVSIHVGC